MDDAPTPAQEFLPAGNATQQQPPTPQQRLRAEITTHVGESIANCGGTAYFEMLARSEPLLFYKWAALALMPDRLPPSGNTVVNVVSALPRTALDDLPPGFNLR